MILDVNFLIQFFKKNTRPTEKGEFGEQETAPTSGGGGKVPKWADTYPIKRGKANMLGKGGEKWQTGLTRGAANQIW